MYVCAASVIGEHDEESVQRCTHVHTCVHLHVTKYLRRLSCDRATNRSTLLLILRLLFVMLHSSRYRVECETSAILPSTRTITVPLFEENKLRTALAAHLVVPLFFLFTLRTRSISISTCCVLLGYFGSLGRFVLFNRFRSRLVLLALLHFAMV